MALSEQQVKTDIGEISANLKARDAKYIRNYNRYMNNATRRDSLYNLYGPPQGYWYSSSQADTGPIPMANVLRSMVDTLVSKLAQTKVRPFFNPVNGLFETRKVARAAQQFFDLYFDMQRVYSIATECRRDAAIFDMGVMRVNEETGNLDRILPYNYYFDRAEFAYQELSRYYFSWHQYPAIYLKDKEWGGKAYGALKEKIERNPIQKVMYTVYYDLAGKKKWHLVDNAVIANESIEFEVPSAVVTFITNPVKGAYTTSVIDDQYTLQTMVDMLLERIELAAELNPANMIMVPTSSDIKRSMVSNEVAAIYEYRPSPIQGAPIQIVTPPAISDQYMEFLKYFIELMYNLEGISQLSAQSKKPSGLDSGVAIQTVEDVESDRFETVLQEHIRFLMDITETCMDVFPQKSSLMPKEAGRAHITWGDLKRQRKLFSVQFAAASALSKDPMVKMQQVEKLIQMGVIMPDDAPQYLDFPDVENAMEIRQAAKDYVTSIIEKAVEKGDFVYDSIAPAEMLERETLTELYKLASNQEEVLELNNIKTFYTLVTQNNAKLKEAGAPPPEPPQQPAPPQEAPSPAPEPPNPPMAPPQGPPA